MGRDADTPRGRVGQAAEELQSQVAAMQDLEEENEDITEQVNLPQIEDKREERAVTGSDIVDVEEREEEQTQQVQRSHSSSAPGGKQQRRKTVRSQRMPTPAREDMRVSALETNLAIVTEERDYWKAVSQNYQRVEGAGRAGLKTVDPPVITLHNSMSVNMRAEGIVVENIEKGNFEKTEVRKRSQSRERNIERKKESEDEDQLQESEEENRLQEDGGSEEERMNTL